MEKEHNIQLTSAEMSYLWSAYQADTLSLQMFKYFLVHIEDKEIENLIRHALDLSQQHIEILEKMFKDEGMHIPQGFGDADVNIEAKRLFSDSFYLLFLKQMAQGGLVTYSRALPLVFREDVLSYFSKCMTSVTELNKEVTDVLLEKGLAVRPPYIPVPKDIEFVKKQSFVLEGLGNGRPLLGPEIANLFKNIQTNHMGSSLCTAYAQVTQSKKLQKLFLRGKNIALKHVDIFSDYLKRQSLPVPMSSDQMITESTDAPFSDKLMFYQFSMMMYSGIGNYGASISESQRSDLVVDYSRLLMEVMKFSEDIMNEMIENEWLEKPPSAIDRKG